MGDRKKYYRYMSQEEFIRYMRGQTMKNDTDYSKDHDCESKGFCFLGEKIKSGEEEIGPNDAYAFLKGIVSGEVLVEFEADEDLFTKSKGTYNDPNTWDPIIVEEYNLSEYNLEKLKPLRYATNEVFLGEKTPFEKCTYGFKPDWKQSTEYFMDKAFEDKKHELDTNMSKDKEGKEEI